MNRIHASPLLSEYGCQVDRDDEASVGAAYTPVRGSEPYAMFAPLHYEANYAYPLLVWLHGEEDDESQLKRIMPFVSLRNYLAVAPRGTVQMARKNGRPGYGWSQGRAHVTLAEQRVFMAIDEARRRCNVADQRIFVAGFGCGGTMAFRLALSHPRQFAGVLSLDGAFPAQHTPLVRLVDARRLQVFLACGRHSDVYPTATACDNLRLIYTAGMDVDLREYPCGHEIMPDMLAAMDRWMMDRVLAEERC